MLPIPALDLEGKSLLCLVVAGWFRLGGSVGSVGPFGIGRWLWAVSFFCWTAPFRHWRQCSEHSLASSRELAS